MGLSSSSPPRKYAEYRVAVVGASKVGKTTLVRALARQARPRTYQPTKKVEAWPVVAKRFCTIHLYDVGAETPAEQAEEVLRFADAVLLAFDHTRSQRTLAALHSNWRPRIYDYCGPRTLLVVTALKVPTDALWDGKERLREELSSAKNLVAQFGNVTDMEKHGIYFLESLWRRIETLRGEQQQQQVQVRRRLPCVCL